MIITCMSMIVAMVWGPGDRGTPDQQYRALFEEHAALFREFAALSQTAKSPEELQRVDDHPGRKPMAFAHRFLALAKKYPETTAAEDSLVWIGSHAAFGADSEEAKRITIRDHVNSAKLGPLFAFQFWSCGSEASERLMREALAKNSHREVRAV